MLLNLNNEILIGTRQTSAMFQWESNLKRLFNCFSAVYIYVLRPTQSGCVEKLCGHLRMMDRHRPSPSEVSGLLSEAFRYVRYIERTDTHSQ